MFEVEKEDVGRFTVTIVHDDDRQLCDAVNDEPMFIFCRERGGDYQVLDQSKNNFPPMEFMRRFSEQDFEECLTLLCDSRYTDSGKTESGKYFADHPDWIHDKNQNGRRYYKTESAALSALFFTGYGKKMADLKVETFENQYSTYYLAFWQSELDKYAGNKNARSCLSDLQHIIDGEVYGFIIGDSSDDHIESCWGFIGDSDYALQEGRDVAEYMEKQEAEKDAIALASLIAESRPDLAPA